MSKSELGTGIGVAFSRQVANRLVASQSAMLALTDISPGQIVIREDDGYYNYLLKALPANSLANWQPMGKDASPIGETVADIITTNENLVAKPDGLYAIAGVPLGGIPSGVALGDIVQKTGVVYTIAYTFSTAPATIYSNSDQKTYNKKTNGAGNPTWETTPIPTTYPCGVGFKYITLQAAIDAYTADFLAGIATVGIIDLWDSIYNENVTILSTVQNLHIRGIGTKYRSNTLVSRITILGHRVTLQNILLTNIAQTPLVINSSGTITESGVQNVAKGKHVLDQVTFSTSQTNAIDVQACDNFLILNNCDFDSKVINIGNKTGTATSITIDGCNNGILNLGNNRFATKNNSLSVYRGTISSTGTLLIDVDAAKPIAYSILRSYSALGATIPVALGTLIINDDVGSTLQTLKCTTAYTIPVTINTGTPIDLTKYQVETDNLKQNTIPDGDNINEPRSTIASATTTNLNTATSDVINITGTTAITGFTLTNGVKKILVFGGALTLTHNATSLILPTSANITTAANDSCIVIGTANGVQITFYQRANGTPLSNAGYIINDLSGFNSTSAPAIAAVSSQFVAQGGKNYIQNGDFSTVILANANTNLNNTDANKAPTGTQAPALQYFPGWYVTSNDASSTVSLLQTEFFGKKYATFEATVGGNGEAFNTRILGVLPKILNKNVTFSFLFRTTDTNIGNVYQARLSYSIDGNATPVFLGSFAINIAASSANLAGSNNVPLLFSQAVSIQGNTTVEQRISRRIQIRNFVLSTPPATPISTLSTPPANPALNDAYIVGTFVIGAWSGIATGTIVQWNGTAWVTVVAINDAYVVGSAPTGAWSSFAVNSIATWNGTTWVNSTGNFSNGFLQFEIQKFSGTDFAQFSIGEAEMEEGLLATSFEYKNTNIAKLLDNVANTGIIPTDMVQGGGGGGGNSSGGFYGKVIHRNSTNLSGITDEETITFNTLNYATAGNTDFISHNGGSVFTLQPGFHYFIQWQSASYNAQGYAALNIDGVDVSGVAGTISNTLTPTKIGSYALTIPVGADAKQIKLTAELGSSTTPLSIHEPMLEVTAFKIGTIPPVSADPYLQIGGNATGAKVLSGTNDNQDYFFKTNGVERCGVTRFGDFVLPSLTTTQRNAITSPANGSVIYNTTTGNVEFRQNGTWIPQFVAYLNLRGDSTPIVVRQSYNIASVVRTAIGGFTINLSNGVTNVERVFIACVAHNGSDIPLICRYNPATSSTTALDVKFVTSGTSVSNPLYANILIFNL